MGHVASIPEPPHPAVAFAQQSAQKWVMWRVPHGQHIPLVACSPEPSNAWCGICPRKSVAYRTFSPAMPDVASIPESPAVACSTEPSNDWCGLCPRKSVAHRTEPSSAWCGIYPRKSVACSPEPSNAWCGIYPRKSCHWHSAPSTWGCGICIQSPQQGTSSPASPTGGLCWWTKTEPLEADICILTGPQPRVASTPANPTNCTY